jgi:predicted exporter
VNSLIPADQDAKLAIIRDAALILDTTLSPFDVAAPPTDAEVRTALAAAAARLTAVAGRKATPVADTTRQLAQRLHQLSDGTTEGRTRAARVLTGSLAPALDQVRATLTAEPVTLDTLPPDLKREWISARGEARVDIAPSGDPADAANLARFITAVRAVSPNVSGPPVAVLEAGRTILGAFIEAGVLSTLAIGLMLAVILRRATDVLLTLVPVMATLVLTLATLAVTRQPINLENLIALPLLLGIGVSFNIYSVIAWRDESNRQARASLSHAILFSALTTGASFLALALSAHPGTASLGRLLLITLGWTLFGALFLQPALLATVRRR